jgi:hypothetical protein
MTVDINPSNAHEWLLDKEYAVAKTFAYNDAAAVGGVIKSGTIYPTNAAGAQGIVVNDITVASPTGARIDNADTSGAILVKGVVSVAELTRLNGAAPAAAAITALKDITFLSAGQVQ